MAQFCLRPSLVVFLSIASFWLIQLQIQNRRGVEFKWAVQNRSNSVQLGINEGLEAVRGIKRLFLASDDVNRQEFKIFTQSILTHTPYIHALEWIPRVMSSQRIAYEEQAQDGFYRLSF